jgi:Putative Ig domain
VEFAATGLPASYTGSVTPGSGYTMQLQDTGRSRAANETDILTRASNDYAGRFYLSSNTNWSIVVATFAAAGPLHITTQTLPDATLNSPYRVQLAAGGGSAPYSWSVASPHLFPSGLTLDSGTGVISGAPGDYGQFTFTIAVTDAASHTAYRFFNLLVPAPPTVGTVQMNSVEGTGVGSVSVPFKSSNTAGNLIVAFVRMSTTWQSVTVTDTAGNVYADAASQVQTADGHQIHVFYAKNIAGGPNSVTATFSSTNNHPWLAVFEYTGLNKTNPLDQTAHAQGSSASADSGSIQTSSYDLLVEAVGLPASYTGAVMWGGSTPQLQDTGGSRAAAQTDFSNPNAPAAARFNLSSPSNWTAVIVAFKQ